MSDFTFRLLAVTAMFLGPSALVALIDYVISK